MQLSQPKVRNVRETSIRIELGDAAQSDQIQAVSHVCPSCPN